MSWKDRKTNPQGVLYLDNMAEFVQQSRQGTGIIVLQTQPVAKGLAVLCEQLADRKAGVLLSSKQLDQLSCQSLDTLHFCQSQHFLLTALQHLIRGQHYISCQCFSKAAHTKIFTSLHFTHNHIWVGRPKCSRCWPPFILPTKAAVHVHKFIKRDEEY